MDHEKIQAKLIDFDDIMEEMKHNNPERYCKIKESSTAKVQQIKAKHGGARTNAGRKKIYTDGVAVITKKISVEAKGLLGCISEELNVSEGFLLDRLIKTAYTNTEVKQMLQENLNY